MYNSICSWLPINFTDDFTKVDALFKTGEASEDFSSRLSFAGESIEKRLRVSVRERARPRNIASMPKDMLTLLC